MLLNNRIMLSIWINSTNVSDAVFFAYSQLYFFARDYMNVFAWYYKIFDKSLIKEF